MTITSPQPADSASDPTFSLVIPCYNEGPSLPELIARCSFVAEQARGEIILVDNGSTDDTKSILEKILHDAPFVRWTSIKVNQGYGNGILAGLKIARAPIVGWTHADLQTDPADILRALPAFASSPSPLFIKGRRFGRPFADRLFTAGMSAFESLLLGKRLSDINAQPTLFSKELMVLWGSPPKDFSLDLFAFVQARRNRFTVKRFPVIFASRRYGQSSWNVDFRAKWKFIKRTLSYSFALRKKI
jgi:glycosyltransferase involved in cell wall biosynthesis